MTFRIVHETMSQIFLRDWQAQVLQEMQEEDRENWDNLRQLSPLCSFALVLGGEGYRDTNTISTNH